MMSRIGRYFCTTLLIFTALPVILQAQTPLESLRLYFEDVRSSRNPAFPKVFSLPDHSRAFVEGIPPYLNDTSFDVRSKAYRIVSVAGTSARQQDVRALAVSQLVNGINDIDGGNADLALAYLTGFRKEDFPSVAKDSIRSLVRRKSTHTRQLLRLAGFLELIDLKEAIRSYSKVGNSQPIRWAAIVSLARMNDNEASTEMMRRVRKLAVNDDVIYEVFPDLVYSRHPEAIAYMVEALKSDDGNCLTADPEREAPIPCGYRIMEQLAPVIEKYPLELDESGDVKAKDYPSALKKVREWFSKNTSYNILRDKY